MKKRFFKKVKQFFRLLKLLITKDDITLLRFIQDEAIDYLELCEKYGTKNTEDIQDLLFHIQAYFEAPEAVKATLFQEEVDLEETEENKYIRYIEEVERQRAVERDFICELMKSLPIGFRE